MDLPENWHMMLIECQPETVSWLNNILAVCDQPELVREIALMCFREGRVYQAGEANRTLDLLLAQLDRRSGNA